MRALKKKYILNFKRPSGTSRGVLKTKETWFLQIEQEGLVGIGECALFRGLSADDTPLYEEKLQWLCDQLEVGNKIPSEALKEFPSIQFGLETALKSIQGSDPFHIFPSMFTDGRAQIPINGLVWMGDFDFMRKQIIEKIHQGFSCIKLKIGAIDFDEELQLLSLIRKEFSSKDIELRVDANGAFSPDDALEKLKQLAQFDLHSIEQPIKPKQWEKMAHLCEQSPLDIALDEELIGVFYREQKVQLLRDIKPQYIILKPALVGGFSGSEEWISVAEDQSIKWWVTSALESNIGLNAIAQWTYSLGNFVTQGLGTGGLFTNNFDSPLVVKSGNLHFQPEVDWNYNFHI
ncbi:MAG: o-succinylbenzoate synthase [Bacteroidota bacterium]